MSYAQEMARAQGQGAWAGGDGAIQQIEEARAFTQAMTQLASVISDLDNAARAIAGRIGPLLPSGSPYNHTDKVASAGELPTPKAVRSRLCDQIHDRIGHIATIAKTLNEMTKSIEI